MEKLSVYYDNRIVGYLAKYENKYAFSYDPSWILNGFSISPFSLPLKSGVFVPKENIFNGFFGVFADSMPDSWGNLLLNRYLRNAGINAADGLLRLSIIGSSGMGALEYLPNNEIKEQLEFNLDKFQDEADKILNKEEADFDYLFKYGGSSGGARLDYKIPI